VFFCTNPGTFLATTMFSKEKLEKLIGTFAIMHESR
jgi:hypothetical protein